MRGRRRRPRVVWLPLQQADSIRADQLSSLKFGQIAIDATTQGNGAHIEFPLVADGVGQGQDPTVNTNSLADIEQSGYRLRRVVGKIWCFAEKSAQAIGIGEVIGGCYVVTAGLMVRREDNLTGLSLANTAGAQEIATDATRNIMDPWIWRRSWVIADPNFDRFKPQQNSTLANPLDFLEGGVGPDNFSHGPAVADGPHCDAKTARIVGPEERLFLDFSARVLFPGNDQSAVTITLAFDLRILGSMRTSSGNRRNSNR